MVSEPTALLDLMPTVLDYLGIKRPTGLRGTQLFGSAERSAPILLETEPTKGDVIHLALRSGSLKLIDWRGPKNRPLSLFDLSSDPAEQKDLALEQPALVNKLHDELKATEGTFRTSATETEPAGLDRETEELLRSLGYLD
jgi:arylsulfatase A-like enzyme